jgi:alkylglycerol monooxygenase
MTANILMRFLIDRLGPMFYLVSPYALALNSKDAPPKYLSRASPMFILFVFVEIMAGHIKRLREPDAKRCPKYRLRDVICSTSSGMLEESLQLVAESFGLKLTVFLYALVHRRFRLFKYDAKKYPLTTWLGLFLGVDLGYYLLHRCNHEWHLFWAGHRVHHSGEDYNLATALRQSLLQRFTSPFFYLPLALVFNPNAFSAHQQLNTLYQFWQHTELIGWLGPLEYILQTPASHRMHHRPPGNCNYAGVLIIWDRMFGSHQCENDTGYQDHFGLAESGSTFSALELNSAHWRRMANIPGSWLKRITSRRPTGNAWVFQPGNIFKPLPQPTKPDKGSTRKKYQGPEMTHREQAFILAAGLLALLRFLVISEKRHSMRTVGTICGAGSVVATLCALGQHMTTGTDDARILVGLSVASVVATASI